MPHTEYHLSATELFKSDCKKHKITQKALSNAFGVKELTVNRMLNQESGKLEEAFQLISTVTKLTGKMAFQYTDSDLAQNTKLQLIDKITRMSDEEIGAMNLFYELLHTSNLQGYTLFSSSLQYEAMFQLTQLFPKILKVNLTEDTYTIVQCKGTEWSFTNTDSSDRLSEWLKAVGNSDFIYPTDRERFLDGTGLFSLRMYLRKSDKPFTLTYRRKFGKEYHWVTMFFRKSVEYSNQNQVVFLCLADMNNLYLDLHAEATQEHPQCF